MAATVETTTRSVTPSASLSLWRPGLAAAIAAGAATTAVAAVARGLGATFETAPGEAIPLPGFAQFTIIFSVIGILIARSIGRRARRPRPMFTTVAVTLTVLSFVPDAAMPFDTASKLTLMLTHVVAAAIVIPVLASRLPQRAR
jgi:hypothetical protein